MKDCIDLCAMSKLHSCFIGSVEVLAGALLAPVLAIVAFNIVIFVIVLTVLVKHSKKKIKRAQAAADGSSREATVRLLISIFSIMNMYGLTWVFGIFTFTNGSPVFRFLFAIFNSLQGFFIFLFFCVLGKEARDSWTKLLCRGKLKKFAPTTSNSRPTPHHSSSAQTNTGGRRYSAQTSNTLVHSGGTLSSQARHSSYSVETLRSLSSSRPEVSEEHSSVSVCEETDSSVPDIIEFNREALTGDTLERRRQSRGVPPMLTVHEEEEEETDEVIGASGGDEFSSSHLGAAITVTDNLDAPYYGAVDSASVSGASLAESGIMIDEDSNYASPHEVHSPPPSHQALNESPPAVLLAPTETERLGDIELSQESSHEELDDSSEVLQNVHAHDQ